MRSFLLSLFTGTAKVRSFKIYLLGSMLLLLFSLLLSQVLFPGGYSPSENFISDQGVLKINPVGGWFFIIGITITGFLFIPYHMFIFRRNRTILPWISILPLMGGVIGSIGLSMVGCFPKGGPLNSIHNTGSTLAWYGLLASMLISSFIMGWGILKRNKWPNPLLFIIIEIMVFFIGIQVFILDDPSMRQWTAFITVFIWHVLIFFVIPDRIDH